MQFAKPVYISRARHLRQQSMDVEQLLWNRIRSNQLGYKFRRQHPTENYILDFACDPLKLCIELDGGQHNESKNQEKDDVRTRALEKAGWQVLRFWNHDVIENIEGVLVVITQALTRRAQERADLSQGRGIPAATLDENGNA